MAGATAAEVDPALVLAKAHPHSSSPCSRSPGRGSHSSRRRAGRTTSTPCRGRSSTCRPRGRRSRRSSDQLVGTVGPITAAQLKALGPPYNATSIVGVRGLEEIWQRRLAGTPTTEVNVVDSTGAPVVRLATHHGTPGRAVRRASTRASSEPPRTRWRATPTTSRWSRCERRPEGPGGRLRPRRLRVRRGATGPVPARVDVQGADLDGADPPGPDPGLAGHAARRRSPSTARRSTTRRPTSRPRRSGRRSRSRATRRSSG